jgi:hypothetical protein
MFISEWRVKTRTSRQAERSWRQDEFAWSAMEMPSIALIVLLTKKDSWIALLCERMELLDWAGFRNQLGELERMARHCGLDRLAALTQMAHSAVDAGDLGRAQLLCHGSVFPALRRVGALHRVQRQATSEPLSGADSSDMPLLRRRSRFSM